MTVLAPIVVETGKSARVEGFEGSRRLSKKNILIQGVLFLQKAEFQIIIKIQTIFLVPLVCTCGTDNHH